MIFKRLVVKRVAENHRGLFADEDIKKGKKILDFPGKILAEKKSNQWDLQISKNKVIRTFSKNQINNFLNHSCEPNSFVKKIGNKFYLIALKNIKKEDEITFDYDTTDYDTERFGLICTCKSENCRKKVRGFKYLNAKQKKRLEKYLIPYLKRIFEKEKSGKRIASA